MFPCMLYIVLRASCLPTRGLQTNRSCLDFNEDSIKTAIPTDVYKESPYLEHGSIESRIYRIYRGEELIADKEKWNGYLTVIEILTSTQKKSDGRSTSEQRLYISNLNSSAERLSQITKQHWATESMHWGSWPQPTAGQHKTYGRDNKGAYR